MREDKVDKVPEGFELLEQFISGDEDAFTRIVEKYSGPLINFLYRYTRDRGASEDLAQEAFLRLCKAATNLEPGAKLSTILYKIAYNLAVDRARKDKSRTAGIPVYSFESGREGDPARNEPAASPATTPDAIYETGQQNIEIAAKLAALPETQQLALILKVYEDRSYAEIAEIMELSISSVQSLLFRARQNLAQKLKASCDPGQLDL